MLSLAYIVGDFEVVISTIVGLVWGVDFTTFSNSAKFHSCYRRVMLSLHLTAPDHHDNHVKCQDRTHRDD